MKELIYTSLLLTIFPLQAQEFKETTDVVDAQVKITRGLIDNIMEEIQTEQVDMGFDVDDYYAQVQNFKNEANEVMINFEDQMQEQVFNPAKKLISEYNNVYNSNVFSSIQKTEILRELKKNIDEEFTVLSAKYISLVQELYAFGGLSLDGDFYKLELNKKYDEFKSKDKDYSSKKHELEVTIQVTPTSPVKKLVIEFHFDKIVETHSNGKKVNETNRLDNDWIQFHTEYRNNYIMESRDPLIGRFYYLYKLNFEKLFNLVKNKLESFKIFPLVDRFQQRAQGRCETKMCKYLRAADYKKFLLNVNIELDKRIIFKLADKKSAVIENKLKNSEYETVTGDFDDIYEVLNSRFIFGHDFYSFKFSLTHDESGATINDLDENFAKLLYILTNTDE